MSLYQTVPTNTKRGSDVLAGERPNKLTRKSRGTNEPPRPVRPMLKRSGSTRSIFAGAFDIMPSLLSLSSMIRGASSSKPTSVSLNPSPTATSFLSNNTTSDNLPALISPTESTFSSASQDTIDTVCSTISASSAPIDLPFSPSFVRGEDEWDISIGDSTMNSMTTGTIDLQGSYTPVCYEGIWGKTVGKKDHLSLGNSNEEERENFLSVLS
ncbi:uncharacterized protein JCM6883_000257 [Sporobolomyces salmoneus]|uniref:uncharacterized protein n=1 Tax=Sporobolomyces salmoneus TaxID=183962 RepID=UPI00316F9ED5